MLGERNHYDVIAVICNVEREEDFSSRFFASKSLIFGLELRLELHFGAAFGAAVYSKSGSMEHMKRP